MATYAATQVSDEELAEKIVVSSDPDEHVERIREVEKLGATAVCLMNVSGADPHGRSRSTASKCSRAFAKRGASIIRAWTSTSRSAGSS